MGRELPTAQGSLILILETGRVREDGRANSFVSKHCGLGRVVDMWLLWLGLVFFCTGWLTLIPCAWT